MSSSNFSSQGSGSYAKTEAERLSKPEGVDNCQETVFFRHSRTDAHTNSCRLWQHAQDLHTWSWTKSSAQKRKWAPIPSSSWEATWKWEFLGKRNPAFPQWSSTEDVRVLMRMLEYSCSGVSGQQKTDSMRFFAGVLWFEFGCLSF